MFGFRRSPHSSARLHRGLSEDVDQTGRGLSQVLSNQEQNLSEFDLTEMSSGYQDTPTLLAHLRLASPPALQPPCRLFSTVKRRSMQAAVPCPPHNSLN